MARAVTTQRKTINTLVAWAIGLLIFFPILWTILTSFKTEAQAINDPPLFLFFDWTLENYSVVQEPICLCSSSILHRSSPFLR